MLDGRACDLPAAALGRRTDATELFLRSVWWHYRLRRYGNTLAVECRPFARREDAAIIGTAQLIRIALGI